MNRILRLTAAFALAAAPAWAGSDPNYDHAYASGTGRKLERGVSNLSLGLMEIPAEMTREGKAHGALHAVFIAPFTGALKAVGRTAAGVYETATFPLPTPPAPEPLVRPEFVLDKEASKS